METDSFSQNNDAPGQQTGLSEDVEMESISISDKGDSCITEEVGSSRVVSPVVGTEHLSKRINTSWCNLPTEIVGEITSKIESPKDCLNFVSTSKLWISNAPKIIHCCPNKIRSSILHAKFSLPMVLQTFKSTTGTPCLYDIFNKKEYNMHNFGLNLSKMWIAATWRGWLVVTDFKPTNESRINLVNPFTNLQIALPSWSTFLKSAAAQMNFATVSRVLLVSPDSTADPGNCSVYAIVGNVGNVHYCRVGSDNKWRCLFPYLWSISDLTVHRGLLYAVQFDDSLYAMESKYPCKPTLVVKGNFRIRGSRNYMVESVSGELLLITRLRRYAVPHSSIETSGFKVCKLVENQDKLAENTWEEIESFGDQILFVGYNGAMCFDSSSHPGIKGNCIYFAHDFSDTYFGGHGNLGVYYMEDKRIEYFPENISNAHFQAAATWFSPNW